MVQLTGSVGDGGNNAKHDVCVVQLMLRLIRNPKGTPYLAANYTGTYDVATKDALFAFQKDQGVLSNDPKAPASALGAQKGLVASPSTTLAKLNAALPGKYAPMRIIPGTTTVYLPTPQGVAHAAAGAISNKADLDSTFRLKVAAVVNTMYAEHKIALGVVGPGWRRTFATQAAQKKTGAGPGESNHNFGRAVDLGFHDYQWIKGDGSIAKEGGWLGSASLGGAKSEQLWKARDDIALKKFGLFLTNYKGERVHLQSFNDATANNRASLAKLLTTVGWMKWQHKGQYQVDLGLGGKLVNAGTAKEIWTLVSPISASDVAVAATGHTLGALHKSPLFAKLDAVQKVADALAKSKGPPPPASTFALTAKDVTGNDLKTIREALKAEFEKADAGWSKWVPVP